MIKTTSVPRIYTSRPSCIIWEVDTEYLSSMYWYLPINFYFLEKDESIDGTQSEKFGL